MMSSLWVDDKQMDNKHLWQQLMIKKLMTRVDDKKNNSGLDYKRVCDKS